MRDQEKLRIAESIANQDPDADPECDHRWVYKGSAKDGTAFYKCSECGEESE